MTTEMMARARQRFLEAGTLMRKFLTILTRKGQFSLQKRLGDFVSCLPNLKLASELISNLHLVTITKATVASKHKRRIRFSFRNYSSTRRSNRRLPPFKDCLRGSLSTRNFAKNCGAHKAIGDT